MKRLLLVLLVVLGSSCGLIHALAPSLSDTDAVSYQVSGTGATSIIVNFSVPISTTDPTGIRQLTTSLPFSSPVFAAYSQFTKQNPSITATADGSPVCLDVYVLVNGKADVHTHDCGAHLALTASK